MNRSISRTSLLLCCVGVVFASIFALASVLALDAIADDSDSKPKPRPQPKTWVTVTSGQQGYQLRLLTDAEKAKAEIAIRQRESAASGGDKSVEDQGQRSATAYSATAYSAIAYSALPLDIRAGRFYEVLKFGPDFVEFQDKELHAMLPMSSIRIVLMGPRGTSLSRRGGVSRSSSATRGSTPSPEDFIRALRGGGSGGLLGSVSGGRGLSSRGGGAISQRPRTADKEAERKEPAERLSLFHLQYAEAANVAGIVEELLGRSRTARITVDQRTNAIVAYGDQKDLAKIEQLVEALDTELPEKRTAGGKTPKSVKEAPTLMTYQVKQTDPETALEVMQTLLAGIQDVRLAFDPGTKKIVALAREPEHALIQATLKELEKASKSRP